MNYEAARRHEIKSNVIRVVNELVKTYDPNKKTVILLPGGMGSHLERTDKPYSSSNPGPFEKYETVWIDFGIIFGADARTLEIEQKGEWKGRDKKSHIIVANGPLGFFVKPYNGTEDFFRNNGYNYAVFGFDWRRRIEDCAFWLNEFLKLFRDGVIKRFKGNISKNPLPTTTLLCHSQGGFIAKVFLHRVFSNNSTTNDVKKWFEQVITVATPFYGTSTHMRRYYKGVDLLNRFYGAKDIARIVATLPGPYTLIFLDKQSYNSDGAALGLNRYPVRDANNPNIEVDPYNPSNLSRYPKWVSQTHLAYARGICSTIRRRLPQVVINRVFHIRSGKDNKTWIEKFWKPIDGSSFDPKDPYPISGINGPGDGTVPFWSSRLAQTPDSQIYNLRMARDHGSLLEHEETLKVVKRIMDTGVCPQRVTASDKYLGVSRASRNQVDNFLQDVKRNRIKIEDVNSTDPKIWRGVLADISLC